VDFDRPHSIHFVQIRDDSPAELKPVPTTDGIHQGMNPWNSAATYRRDGNFRGFAG
jgi:hypothetical protein